jgi:hypothetical protein
MKIVRVGEDIFSVILAKSNWQSFSMQTSVFSCKPWQALQNFIIMNEAAASALRQGASGRSPGGRGACLPRA